MIFIRFICCLVLLLAYVYSKAQLAGVVFDMETKRPVAGAKVYINPKGSVDTDSNGHFVINQSCNSVTFSHVSYENRVFNKEELPDTVWLLPRLNRLDEVVITAQGPKICVGKQEVSEYASKFKAPKSGFSFDIATLFNFKKNKRDKRRKRLEKILKDY